MKKHAKTEWTIGNLSYVQVTGPGSSYYTSICDLCGIHASALFQHDRMKMLLCKNCYADLCMRYSPERVEPKASEAWIDFWMLTALALALVLLVVALSFVIVRALT